MASTGKGNILLQFLAADSQTDPKKRMEQAVLDEDAGAMRQLVTSGSLRVNDELTAQSALTAMHLAARYDRPAAIRALVELGADPQVTNFLDQTPIGCAISAKAPRALLELARRAPIGWRQALRAFKESKPKSQMDSYVSFTMHLLVGLMQPVRLADPDIALCCLTSYASLVRETTEWAEELVNPPLRPTKALFPTEAELTERQPFVRRYVSESPFLLDSLMRPEAFFSALLGVYSYSGVLAALLRLGASDAVAAAAQAALASLRETLAEARDPTGERGRPQSLAFACRNVVRNCASGRGENYVHVVHSLPLDFATKAFLTYSREVTCVMDTRPRNRYTGM